MTMTEDNTYKKPLPVLSDLNAPFWKAGAEGHLQMQQCQSCDHIRYPISHICPNCLSEETKWKRLSGRGIVFSTVVFHQVYNEAFRGDVPYNASMIQLEEGPRMMSNVVGVDPSAVKVGDPVEVVFENAADDIFIPRFKPAGQ